DQFRLDGVRLSAAAFTNLGRDHLDYHPTVEAYMAAKMRLFEELLQPGQPAVLNTDGAEAGHVEHVCKARGLQIMTVGSRGDAIRLNGVRRDGFSQVLSVEIDGGSRDVLLPLVGGYQVENALVAAGLCLAVGLKADDVLAGLSQLSGVPGRLDIAGEARGGLAVIDYAHKPEALEAALAAVRPFVSGRLICVFGCGGDRDRGKRPIMGRIAAAKSDVVIVTDDNPRTEDAQAIRAEI
ncbi:MAG: cyanophycin synthetase, partial [Pseudomonadota bacterium]